MSAPARESSLSARQERALACLLSEATVSAAAARSQVGEATLRRWLKLEVFARAYQQARQESYRESLRLLRRAANAAIGVLVKIMQDGEAPKTARIRAAEVILEHDRKGVVEEDLLIRVHLLEEAFHAPPPP